MSHTALFPALSRASRHCNSQSHNNLTHLGLRKARLYSHGKLCSFVYRMQGWNAHRLHKAKPCDYRANEESFTSSPSARSCGSATYRRTYVCTEYGNASTVTMNVAIAMLTAQETVRATISTIKLSPFQMRSDSRTGCTR